MAWLGKVSLGNFSDIAGAVSNFGDIAGAVTKLSESVKNIEKNFDSALGFEDKSKVSDDAQTSSGDKGLRTDPTLAHTGQGDSQKEVNTTAANDEHVSETRLSETEKTKPDEPVLDQKTQADPAEHETGTLFDPDEKTETSIAAVPPETVHNEDVTGEQLQVQDVEGSPIVQQQEEGAKERNHEASIVVEEDAHAAEDIKLENESLGQSNDKLGASSDVSSATQPDATDSFQGLIVIRQDGFESAVSSNITDDDVASAKDIMNGAEVSADQLQLEHDVPNEVTHSEIDGPMPIVLSEEPSLVGKESAEVENLRLQIKQLDAALQGAAYQSKVKADEMSRLSMENDNLRSTVEELKKKLSDGEMEALKEEFQQRLNSAERKVYALTKERDMLRREQSRRDSSILLKEKDEIIKQVMAEGEELSKKQAAQEAQMRKLRAQIRELEEEKQRLKSKLQVEEATVESLRKDKAATEKALQEAVERTQVELAAQKEFYLNALNEAKEAEARAGVRADNEAKMELERRLLEAGERERALVETLEELRQALSRASQQAASREDTLRRDIEDLEKLCQAAELRYEELVASVPESTRPLLRQIEAIRESTALRAEAWSGVERALNARLQEAEAKAAASQERERAINERLTQTLSRMAVLEAQVSCLKAEQAQLTRSLEKERQRASENRQEYLAALESAATHEGHAKQLEEEMKELRTRFKRELTEEKTMRELLQQEVEREKKKKTEHEALLGNGNWSLADKNNASPVQAQPESSPRRMLRRFSSASSGSVEESLLLQASLDSMSDQGLPDLRNIQMTPPSYSSKGVFPNATIEQLEALLTQREGELALYTSRLASLESTRDALAEELVKATTQCEKLRSDVASLPSMRSELESLRQRHTSALELMGERDEQVEELRADLADVKQMYREQIDMLVNQIQKMSSSINTN